MTRARWTSGEASDRDEFNLTRVFFFAALHLGVLAVFWQTNWMAIGMAVMLHVICGGLGVCVGYHRLLTHRSFKCPKIVEYAFALAGSLSMQGGALEWVALHRKHHQHSDKDGDPHNAAEGFWWSHMLWVLHTPTNENWRAIRRRYTPDLEKQLFYRVLEHTHYLGSILLAVGLYFLGGWPFVVWGVCVRLVATYHITWFVNSASHMWGYKNFESDDLQPSRLSHLCPSWHEAVGDRLFLLLHPRYENRGVGLGSLCPLTREDERKARPKGRPYCRKVL